MHAGLTRSQLLYVAKRLERIKSGGLLGTLFGKQHKYAVDKNKRKAALCTRRAGKSWSAGVLLFDAALKYPGATVPYISLTRKAAKNIMWPVLRDIIAKNGIDAEMLDGSLEIKLKNGSVIPLWGADQENFIDRIRGGKYPLVVIDEAQAFRAHLTYLVDDVLDGCVLDYDGIILLMGTPGPAASGYFWEVTEKGKHGFSVHKWSVLDNPHLPHAKRYIKDLKKRKGWTDENPTYRREWLGEWVDDPDALIYRYSDKNDYDELPEASEWTRVMAVDYGFNDKTAFAILAYHPHSPHVYVEHVEGHGGWIPTQIAGRLHQLIEKYGPTKIVADAGALGKMITEEMVRRHGIPMEAADKKDKYTWISLLNGAFVDNTLHIQRALVDVAEQYKGLAKDDKGMEDPNLPNDLCDAILYAWRFCYAYCFSPVDSRPLDQKLPKELDEFERRMSEEMKQKAEGDWWENL